MSSDEVQMGTKEAIEYVQYVHRIKSYYALAQTLSDTDLNVQPGQISNYARGKTVMSEKVAQRFFDVYGIVVTDAYKPGAFQQ